MSAMKDLPLVAICIVTFNSGSYIEACLQGIKQQLGCNFRTVIVDNASVDNTLELIWNAELEVHIISNSFNNGFAAAQNQAIRASNSDYVLVLNPDVVLGPSYIAMLVEMIENNSVIGSATGCLVLASDPEIIDSAGLQMKWNRRAVERGSGKRSSEYTKSAEVFGVSGAAALYSRKMIDHVLIKGQFFDEDFFAYKEDVDVAWRARRLGWKSWYEPEARAVHVRRWGAHVQRAEIPIKIRRHSYQNRYLTIVKNENYNLRWWITLPALIGYEIALNGLLLLRDPRILVGGWMNLLNLLPSSLNKRREIKAKSHISFLTKTQQ